MELPCAILANHLIPRNLLFGNEDGIFPCRLHVAGISALSTLWAAWLVRSAPRQLTLSLSLLLLLMRFHPPTHHFPDVKNWIWNISHGLPPPQLNVSLWPNCPSQLYALGVFKRLSLIPIVCHEGQASEVSPSHSFLVCVCFLHSVQSLCHRLQSPCSELLFLLSSLGWIDSFPLLSGFCQQVCHGNKRHPINSTSSVVSALLILITLWLPLPKVLSFLHPLKYFSGATLTCSRFMRPQGCPLSSAVF